RGEHLSELVEWADIIDGALYPDAKTAVELNSPALRIMLVIESARDPVLLNKIIHNLQSMPLGEVASQSYITDIIDLYYQRHMKAIEIIGNAAGVVGKVVHFDVSGHDMEGYSKFIPYYLYPDTLYSVGVSLSPQRAKISVGFNPWGDGTRNHNLASI